MRRSNFYLRFLAALAVCALTAAGSFGAEEETSRAVDPDLRVVSWRIDDATTGNNDNGLHPGETALIVIELASLGGPATLVSGTLEERVDHPDVTIEDKVALWPDIPGSGVALESLSNHFRIRVETTRPCEWVVPLRLTIRANGGYEIVRDVDIPLTNPRVDRAEEGRYRLTPGLGAIAFTSASGDFNGDGFDDLALGAPLSAGLTAGSAAGRVALIYGPIPPGDRSVFTAANYIIYGNDTGDELGTDLAFADLDGDGRDELIMGAPESDGNGNTDPNAGEVWIVWGDASTPTGGRDLALGGAGANVIWGRDSFDRSGKAIAVGNVNGDGFEDLLIGAPNSAGKDNMAGGAAGEVSVHLGSPSRFNEFAGFNLVFWGVSATSLGIDVETGDVNGDGLDDLLFTTLTIPGKVLVLDASSALTSTELELGVTAGLTGFESFEGIATVVASGDMNGDGYDDVVAAFPTARGADGALDAGRLIVTYGSSDGVVGGIVGAPGTDDRFATVRGAQAGDELGGSAVSTSVSRSLVVADVDGDGIDDLFAGAPQLTTSSDGLGFLIHGSPDGLRDLDLSNPPPGVTTFTENEGAVFGFWASAADLDADGLDDLIVSSALRSPDGGMTTTGGVTVFPGEQRLKLRWDAEAFSYIDATGGTPLGLACDDCGTSIPIGFDFVFDGRTFDTVTVSSNGYLTFGSDGSAPFGFCPGNTASPNGVIAPFWDDLDLTNRGEVYTLVEGVAPNRRLTVEWSAVPVFPDTGDTTFEVTLFESSNRIVMQYQDTFFATSHPSNDGANATVTVEGISGLYEAAYNCSAGLATAGTAIAYRFFGNPAAVYRESFESGTGGYTATGLWHRITDPTCAPSARDGTASFYYGIDGACNFDTGAANAGTLTSPSILAVPQDAALEAWTRRGAESHPTFDASLIQVSSNGGTFDSLGQDLDPSGTWQFTDDKFPATSPTTGAFDRLDLSDRIGDDLQVRFSFDSVDASANFGLGWMVDEVTIRACPVFGGGMAPLGAGAEARATARDSAICEDSTGLLDAVGSYCTACGSGLDYQWKVDGTPIAGATSLSYVIPPGQTPATYGYSVLIGCGGEPACGTESAVAAVDVVQKPVDAGNGLRAVKTGGGVGVKWTWTDAAGADDYVLASDSTPVDRITGFGTVVGTATSGVVGVEISLTNTTEFFLVAGRNPVCGRGPR